MLITIDGPSGSGKTTLSVALAKELDFFCFSSGYIYRSLAYILKTFYNYDQEKMKQPFVEDIKAILASPNFRYEYQYGIVKVYWIDEITPYLKHPDISQFSAMLAKNDIVRSEVRVYEKNIIKNKDTIIEGRAGGAIVYPYADIKFYIDAPVEIRAKRLVSDQLKRGNVISYQDALSQIQARDTMDSTRETEPLKIAKDAIILDSHALDFSAMFQKVLNIIKNYLKTEKSKI